MTTRKKEATFEVDKAGLGKLLERRGKEFILGELFQNAADENVSRVTMEIERDAPNDPLVRIAVEDDNPEGFADITHAYTLFAESNKKGDPTKRGRFNLGEKLVIAVCEHAEISTTKGHVVFDGDGRWMNDPIRTAGSRFEGWLEMTDDEIDRAVAFAHTLIVPEGVEATINGEPIKSREPKTSFEVALRTEKADDEGRLRPTQRKTVVRVYEVLDGEQAHLYEMGIPVVSLPDDAFHIDIGQKVPVNMDRDNVPPYYLRDVRRAVLNALHEVAFETPEDAGAGWVVDALADKEVAPEAVQSVIRARYGDKVVLADPTDREAEKEAVSQGYAVIGGGAFSKDAWSNIRPTGMIQRAGLVTPSHMSEDPHDGFEEMPREHWPLPVVDFEAWLQKVARESLGLADVEMKLNNGPRWQRTADYGKHGRKRVIRFNYNRLGYKWFEGRGEKQLRLVIHELAHEEEADHLSHRYYDACCKVGALTAIAIAEGRLALAREEVAA